MPTASPTMIQALDAIENFIGSDLTARIADLEWGVKGCDGIECGAKNVEAGVTSDLLSAAYAMKRAAAQINVLIHAVGGLLLVPQILEENEKIQYVSLGAGNTGRAFDLETDRRVAEFKFIHWTGGSDTIRQNQLFKDFYLLAEHQTEKRKELFVLDTKYPLKFLRAGRALRSVLSKNVTLWEEFQAKYGGKYQTVCHYYAARQHDVLIRDAAPLVPQLLRIVDIAPLVNDEAEV
ncbi:MAG TPA: hypothetical protein VLC74_00925 [Rhizomicrobium sp.]|nr:hypothetical protein [Rhizomicrobium sp.]